MTVGVPTTLEEAQSPAWLSGALGERFPGIEVTAVAPGPVISLVSTNARFRIECADGLPEGLSPHLCVKGFFTEIGWQFRHAGEPEAHFYRDVAESAGVRTLRSVYADVDPATQHGVVITEDVVEQGATFLDALSDYTVDQAAESLAQLARLHAATWGDPAYAGAAWLDSRMLGYLERRGLTEIHSNFEGPIGAGVPDPARRAERLYEAYGSLARLVPTATPWSVVHGDAHVGNVFLDGGGRPSFVDWQLVQRGPWYLDVGYHLSSALPVEERRRAEADLLRHYLDCLAAGGVQAPSIDEAWQGFRRGVLHGFYLWAITLKVDPAITTELLTRLGTAAADHDALDSVA
jgi:hypothetical protein